MKTNAGRTLGAVAGIWLLASMAWQPCAVGALALAPNSAIFNLDTLSSGTPVGGSVVATLSSSFAAVPAPSRFTGVLTTTIYQNDPNNSLGGLTFLYVLQNDAGGPDDIHRITINGWGNALVMVDNELNGGIAASAATRANANTIGFQWENARLMPGYSSAFIVQTGYHTYDRTLASIIDGGTATAWTFAPVPIPEASTIVAGALLLLPFGVRTIRVLRKKS